MSPLEQRRRECAARLSDLRAGRPAKRLDCNDLAVLGLLPAHPTIGTVRVWYDEARGELVEGEPPGDGGTT